MQVTQSFAIVSRNKIWSNRLVDLRQRLHQRTRNLIDNSDYSTYSQLNIGRNVSRDRNMCITFNTGAVTHVAPIAPESTSSAIEEYLEDMWNKQRDQ